MVARSDALGMVLVLTLHAAFAPPASVLAEPASRVEAEEPAGYRELVSEAVREFGARNFAEARGLFSRAHALFPNARTLRGLGATEFELRNYRECVQYLERALDTPVRSLDDDLRDRTERLLARARGFVGRLELTVMPASATAVIDGMPIRDAKEILLDVGDHELEFHAPGYLPEKRKLRVHGGDSRTLHIVLTLNINLTRSGETEVERSKRIRRIWWYSGAAALLAGTAIGLAVGLRPDRTSYVEGSEGVVVGR
jgi:hypothetical protein